MTDTIGDISGRGYAATEGQVKALGQLSVGAERLKTTIGTTYLRVLVRSAHNLSTTPGATALDAVWQAHKTLYPAVLEGVTTPDVAPLKRDGSAATRDANKARSLERNSRSNFARTAASALAAYVRNGGDLGFLAGNIERVTKTFIQVPQSAATAETQSQRAEIDGDADLQLAPHQERVNCAEAAWWGAVNKLTAVDAAATREYLMRVQERIASEITSL